MVLFPNCKINLGLHVLSKRPDGYHNIETVFYPLGWHDAIEVIMQPNGATPVSEVSPIKFTHTGLPVPGRPDENICLKAYHLLKKDFPKLPPVFFHLHKTIPTGAGLGGGSSDGAATLLLLNNKFKLQLSTQKLMEYALELGSDCPFFINNVPVYATGRGEKTEPVSLDLSGYSLLIIYPGIHIQTAWAFSRVVPGENRPALKKRIQQPVETWANTLRNDFELPVFQKYPQIENLKETLYKNGALYASLSGSGSAVYGIFPKNQAPRLKWDNGHVCKIIP